jgi:hypothetical protein
MDPRRAMLAQVLAKRLTAALDQAQTQGHLELNIDSAAAAALLLGPLYYRSTIEHAPLEDSLIDAAIAPVGTWAQD